MDRMSVLQLVLREAGTILREGFDCSIGDYQHKGSVDLVTEWDMKSEQAVRDILGKHCPYDTIVGEEDGGEYDPQGDVWIVDPLDGTTNFVHRLPFFCVSVAFVRKGVVELGGVYAPILDQLYLAERGKGATLNGKPLSVSSVDSLQQALVATGFAYERRAQVDSILVFMEKAMNNVQGIRRLGSAALDLCQTAAGIFDIYIERGIHAWDIAAGALIVEEAGGRVTDPSGEELDLFGRAVAASNGLLHERALNALIKGE